MHRKMWQTYLHSVICYKSFSYHQLMRTMTRGGGCQTNGFSDGNGSIFLQQLILFFGICVS